MSTANIGWLFYRDYYKDIYGNFTAKSKAIADKKLKDYRIPSYENLIDGLMTVSLRTTYPGLLIGSGYQHDIKSDSAFKLGFYFDYSLGLPVIPGSSVKGLLRSAFPFHNKNLGADYRESRIGYIKHLLKDELKIIETDLDSEQIEKLELEIFEGIGENERIAIGQRDLFLDAFPKESFKHEGRFLAGDYITHHEDPLKNPNPVMFLKVLPEVEFVFNFKLNDSKLIQALTANNKLNLFKQILLDLGIGAKTNVGYGQFKYIPPPIEFLSENVTKAHRELLQYDNNNPENNIFDAKVIQLNDHDYLFELLKDCRLRKTKETVITKFDKDAKRKIKKGKKGDYKSLEVGDEVKIRINQPNHPEEINFTVLPIWKD